MHWPARILSSRGTQNHELIAGLRGETNNARKNLEKMYLFFLVTWSTGYASTAKGPATMDSATAALFHNHHPCPWVVPFKAGKRN
jgi:hypothetical protein